MKIAAAVVLLSSLVSLAGCAVQSGTTDEPTGESTAALQTSINSDNAFNGPIARGVLVGGEYQINGSEKVSNHGKGASRSVTPAPLKAGPGGAVEYGNILGIASGPHDPGDPGEAK